MSDDLPFQLRESTFRKYERFIYEVVDRFPKKGYKVRVHNLKPSTYVARLRDAVSSLLRYQWKTGIDVDKLMEIRPLVEFKQVGENCVYGGPSSAIVEELEVEDISSDSANYVFIADQPDKPTLFAIAVLQTRRLLGPVKLTNADQAILDEIEEMPEFDVGIEPIQNFHVML
jgi:hypothetical protein